jgi:transcription termination factor NusB
MGEKQKKIKSIRRLTHKNHDIILLSLIEFRFLLIDNAHILREYIQLQKLLYTVAPNTNYTQ